MLNRWIEDGLTRVLDEEGVGCIVFSPLAQGQLTSRYLEDIPADSRAAKGRFLKTDQVRNNLPKIQALSAIAEKRGQSLAQMAIAWVLRLPTVTSALLGASSVAQLEENLRALDQLEFSVEELAEIESILNL
jgi:L-glyceraldehyde 3-phosphate reductase